MNQSQRDAALRRIERTVNSLVRAARELQVVRARADVPPNPDRIAAVFTRDLLRLVKRRDAERKAVTKRGRRRK